MAITKHPMRTTALLRTRAERSEIDRRVKTSLSRLDEPCLLEPTQQLFDRLRQPIVRFDLEKSGRFGTKFQNIRRSGHDQFEDVSCKDIQKMRLSGQRAEHHIIARPTSPLQGFISRHAPCLQSTGPIMVTVGWTARGCLVLLQASASRSRYALGVRLILVHRAPTRHRTSRAPADQVRTGRSRLQAAAANASGAELQAAAGWRSSSVNGF